MLPNKGVKERGEGNLKGLVENQKNEEIRGERSLLKEEKEKGEKHEEEEDNIMDTNFLNIMGTNFLNIYINVELI